MTDQPISDGSFSIGSDVWPGLGKAIEEAGEFTTVAGKLLATYGASAYWGGVNLRDCIKDETADLLAALFFLAEESLTPEETSEVLERMLVKLDRYRMWRDLGDDPIT